MKYALLLILFSISFGFSSTAQTSEYRFSVNQIDSYPIAKPLISKIRQSYNTENEPKRILLSFDEKTKQFVLKTDAVIEQADIQTILADLSYSLTSFAKVAVAESFKTEGHE